LNVIPLAFDSLGVRSMATLVETDKRIMIDPGLDLAPKRYGLPPTRIELERGRELSDKINQYAQKTDIFIITHYHHDHYFPEAEFYKDKVLLLKQNKNQILFTCSAWRDRLKDGVRGDVLAFARGGEVCLCLGRPGPPG
jgi:predicted metallo-beta-lactamase superfamily hydrolase